ncbi:MAG: YfhO family protein [bacterium]|nr:YfhO family protein [bacterium]
MLALFAAINLIRFYPIFFQGQTFFFGDNFSLLVPGKLFTTYWLSQGVLPLWNPSIFGGISWIGDISQSILYPSTALFLLFSPAMALNLTVILHLLLTMLGMYVLTFWWSKNHLASLVASVAWMVSSQVVGSSNNLATLQSVAWFPWVIYSGTMVHRGLRSALVAAVIIAAQVFAGYPQHLLLTIPVAVLVSAYLVFFEDIRKSNDTLASRGSVFVSWLGYWVVTGITALGLSSIVLLPFVVTLLDSTRTIQSAVQAGLGSLQLAETIKIFIPYFFDLPVLGIKWGPAWNAFPTALPYIAWFGWLSILLAGRRVRSLPRVKFLLLILLGTLILALSSQVPAFVWLLENVPGTSAIRSSSSILLLSTISLVLLWAMSFEYLKISPRLSTFLKGGLVVLGVAGLLVACTWYWLPQPFWQLADLLTGRALSTSPFHTLERDRLIFTVISANVAINALLAAAALYSYQTKKWLLLVVLLCLELVLNSQGMVFMGPGTLYSSSEKVSQAPWLPVVSSPQSRTLTRNFNRPYTDFGSYWEALSVREPFSDSFVDTHELQTAEHLMRLRDGMTPDWNMVANLPTINGYTTLLPTDVQNTWQSSVEARINALPYIEIDNPLLAKWAVKYYVVDEWFEIEEDFSSLPVAYQQPNLTIYELPSLARFRDSDDQAVLITNFTETPNQISATIENPTASGELIIADRYEAGWNATINGQLVMIEAHDGMRKLPLLPGTNEVVLQYQPLMFKIGLAISAVSVAVVLLLITLTSSSIRTRIPSH